MINKFFIFGAILLFLASFSYGQVSPYYTEFSIIDNVEVLGTVVDEFNGGKFYLNKPISGIFKVTNNKPVGNMKLNITFYSTNNNHHYNCVNTTIPQGDTYYLSCEILASEEEISDTGLYYVNIKIDEEEYIFNSFEIVPPVLTPLIIALLIIGSGLLWIGLKYTKEILPLGILVFNSAILQLIFIYQYLLNPIFIGLISLYIVGNVYIIYIMIQEW